MKLKLYVKVRLGFVFPTVKWIEYSLHEYSALSRARFNTGLLGLNHEKS